MAKKSQRLRRQRRLSKLQQKLQDTGQLKTQPSNSVMIERMEKMDEIVETTPANEISDEQIEEMTKTVEMMIEEVEKSKPEPVVKPMNLMKLKKAELLEIAKSKGCKVTTKNTKAQIIAAIEKQSA